PRSQPHDGGSAGVVCLARRGQPRDPGRSQSGDGPGHRRVPMIGRLQIAWPDPQAFEARGGRPIRFLVASDAPEPGLQHLVNREAVGELDGILGCGDLEPEWLAFLADSFNTPLVYVRGNHDRGGEWYERPLPIPAWLDTGRIEHLAGIPIIGLEWPGLDDPGN